MNIQIRVQVPKPDGSASYVDDTDVEVITDPVIVRAILATIIACEVALAVAEEAKGVATFNSDNPLADLS